MKRSLWSLPLCSVQVSFFQLQGNCDMTIRITELEAVLMGKSRRDFEIQGPISQTQSEFLSLTSVTMNQGGDKGKQC